MASRFLPLVPLIVAASRCDDEDCLKTGSGLNLLQLRSSNPRVLYLQRQNTTTGKGKCKSWCSSKEHEGSSWETKCTWKSCNGCSKCKKGEEPPKTQSLESDRCGRKIECASFDSEDCTAEWRNANANGNLDAFYDRCCAEQGAKPLPSRCSKCCVDETTKAPTAEATPAPTLAPTAAATPAPTLEPTAAPTLEPTVAPTLAPTLEPTAAATPAPTLEPTAAATPTPTLEPTVAATPAPTLEPTAAATPEPTLEPTAAATPAPTLEPTAAATSEPTLEPFINFEFEEEGDDKPPCMPYCYSQSSSSLIAEGDSPWTVVCSIYHSDCEGCPECQERDTPQSTAQPTEESSVSSTTLEPFIEFDFQHEGEEKPSSTTSEPFIEYDEFEDEGDKTPSTTTSEPIIEVDLENEGDKKPSSTTLEPSIESGSEDDERTTARPTDSSSSDPTLEPMVEIFGFPEDEVPDVPETPEDEDEDEDEVPEDEDEDEDEDEVPEDEDMIEIGVGICKETASIPPLRSETQIELDGCKAACLADDECSFISYAENEKSCMMYTGILCPLDFVQDSYFTYGKPQWLHKNL